MPAFKPTACVALLLLLSCFGFPRVAAQTPRQQPAPRPSPTPAQASSTKVDPESADVAITANVRARELRFDVVPNPQVVFTGQPERRTEWSSERQNLPPQVEPGVTYRDIGIRLKIVSVFADIDRIVAEALGEVPASDTNGEPHAADQPAPQRPQTSTTTRRSAPPAPRRPAGRRKPR